MVVDVVIAIIGGSVTIFGAIIVYKKEIKIKELDLNLKESRVINVASSIKTSVLDSFMRMSVYSEISESVTRLFLETKVERFMIFIAVNGVTEFNVVTIIFERYKELSSRQNALARYRNVHIDKQYKGMLKNVEINGFVELDCQSMPDQMLKDMYESERVKHSVVSFVARRSIDEDNDLIVFCSSATTIPFKFNNIEKMHIKNCVEGTLQKNL